MCPFNCNKKFCTQKMAFILNILWKAEQLIHPLKKGIFYLLIQLLVLSTVIKNISRIQIYETIFWVAEIKSE